MYNPQKYKRLEKKIKNEIRLYNTDEFIGCCLNYLYSPVNDPIENLKKHPWLILLLIKWALCEQYRIKIPRRILTNQRFNKILKIVYDLSGAVRMPSEYSHHILFFRNLAYQQFIYQFNFSIGHLTRQSELFSKLPLNHTFNKIFEDKTGLSIQTFIEISLCLLTKYLTTSESQITIKWFSPLFKEFGVDAVNSFLQSISTDKDKLGKVLKSYNQSRGGYNEKYEQTPFLKTPLIKNGETYFCVYPTILYRSIEHFIYDTLREWNASKFMNKFGSIFENYIKKGLSYSGVEFFEESELKKKNGKNSKCVDFLVKGEGANIYIDAKAVEMSYLGKVTHIADVVKNTTKDSAIKAIEQAISVNEKVFKKKHFPEIPFQEKNYLIVITFKELYLGNGNYLYEAIAGETVDKIYEKYQAEAHIPTENMYFLTIQEFDSLMALIKKGITTFENAIQNAVEADKDAQNRKFDFSQHISALYHKRLLPQYLDDESDRIFKKIIKAFKEDS